MLEKLKMLADMAQDIILLDEKIEEIVTGNSWNDDMDEVDSMIRELKKKLNI